MAKTYDDIVRKTVPDPDGSMRPSPEQVVRAYDGTHTKEQDELRLHTAVQAALHGHPEGRTVSLDIRGDVVELGGNVTSALSIDEVEQLVRSVAGVGSVTNKLIVGH